MMLLQNYTVDLFSSHVVWLSYKERDLNFRNDHSNISEWEDYKEEDEPNDLPRWIEKGRATKL